MKNLFYLQVLGGGREIKINQDGQFQIHFKLVGSKYISNLLVLGRSRTPYKLVLFGCFQRKFRILFGCLQKKFRI